MSDAAVGPPSAPDWPELLGAFAGILDEAIGDRSKLRDGMLLIKTLEEERQKQAAWETVHE